MFRRSHHHGRPSPRPRRVPAPRIVVGLAVAVLAGVVVSCGEPDPPPPPPITQVAITTSPGLFPTFSADTIDYVVRCTGAPIHVLVDAPDDHPISIDDQPAATGHLEADVNRTEGQAFQIVDQSLLRAYSVRCLPYDYPNFTVSGHGQQAEYYLTAPFGLGLPLSPEYITIFDRNGVPVWWSKTRQPVNFATRFSDGNLGLVRFDDQPSEVFSLLPPVTVRQVASNAQPPGAIYDNHDVLLLPNGHYVYVYNYRRTMDASGAFPSHTDDTSLHNATVLDHVLVEIDARGNPVWSWDAADHIAPSEMDPQWEHDVYTGLDPDGYDVFHWNSVEATPSGFLLSFRHLDAVFAITKDPGQGDDGEVEWKLGGSPRAESLTVAADPVFSGASHFGGQHDARRLSDGTITLYDNGSGLGRAPRGVRYRLALNSPVGTGGTATLIEQVSDSADVPSSFCCGSARRLPGGNWLFGFGGTGVIAEVASTGDLNRPDGTVVFRIVYDAPVVEYRTEPIQAGALNWFVLRLSMDAQNP